MTQSTDRNGNVHQYVYDTLGRQTSDIVTTLGAGVDGSVRRIDTSYDPQGLVEQLTSFADTAGTQIVNQVLNLYDGLGQLAYQYQAVSGPVDVSTTPVVQYDYGNLTNGSLLTAMVYPNGRTINYNYSGSNLNGAIDAAIGRLDSISDGANSGDVGQVLEQYSYLGLSTIVARNHPQTGINLTLVGTSGSVGSGGDQYVGLDQFGRIVNQNWVNSSTGNSVDNYTYTYDQNSNVTAKNNVLNSAYSETYSYDLLDRLTAVTRGGAAYQNWNLDSQGNWSSSTTSGVTQTRTANAQNQITSITGTAGTPVYDSNGNMTTDQAGNAYVYNAWNQLVTVKNSAGTIIAEYTYNAMGYRVTEAYPQGGPGIPAGTVNYIYYNSNWQAIETRTNGTAVSNVSSQMVWSAAYINAAVLQDTYSAGVLQPDSRLYFLQDANWDTTAIVGFNSTTGTWGVTQRYVYSPYGNITVLNADWSTPPGGTQPAVNNLYQGMTLDAVTGLYYERFRNYSPSLGVWISQDPAGYVNGADAYQFVESGPVGAVDPKGQFYWWGVAHVAIGGAVAVGAVTAVVAAGPELAVGGAIFYGLTFTAGMFEASAGATVTAISVAKPSLNASDIPMTYPQATVGLALRGLGAPVETANAAANLIPIGPPEGVADEAPTVVRFVLKANGYREMITKPMDAYTVGKAVGAAITPSAGHASPQSTGPVRLDVRMSISGPSGFESRKVRAGESLWTIWRGVAHPKPSWQRTMAVNSEILANINSLVPGQYVLAPISSCRRP